MDKIIENKLRKILFTFFFIGFFVLKGVSLPSKEFFLRHVRLDKSSNYNFLYLSSHRELLLPRAYAQDEAKYLVFGPYVPLSPGKYEITYTLKIADNKISQPITTIDVVAKKAQKLFASRTLKGTDFKSSNTYQDFNLQFDTTRGARDFEFRIKYLGSSRLWAKKIGITRVQSYSQEEAVGADLIKGATESSSVVTEAESFLKRSKHREIKIDDPILNRRIGYLVPDSQASSGQDWLVEPWMVEAETSPAEPWKISLPRMNLEESLLFLILGLIAGGIFILTGIFTYRRSSTQQPRGLASAPSTLQTSSSVELKPSDRENVGAVLRDRPIRDDTEVVSYGLERKGEGLLSQEGSKTLMKQAISLINQITTKYLSKRDVVTKRHIVTLIVLTGIILSLFFEDISGLGISRLGGYLLLFYIIFSLMWKMDSRVSIVVALLFLAGCPFLLIAGQKQLAERAAIYAYYFLVIGVVFQLKEYIVEARLAKKEALPAEVQEVHFEEEQPISTAKYRVEQQRKKRRKMRRRRLVMIFASSLAGLLVIGVFLRAKPLNKSATKAPSRASSTTTEQKARPKYASEKKEKIPIGKGNIKLQVLNGNGIQGEAAAIGDLLKSGGFNVIGTENADNFDYSETIIRYKSGLGDIAGLVKLQIAERYTGVLREDLPLDYGVDVEVILGRKGQSNLPKPPFYKGGDKGVTKEGSQ